MLFYVQTTKSHKWNTTQSIKNDVLVLVLISWANGLQDYEGI